MEWRTPGKHSVSSFPLHTRCLLPKARRWLAAALLLIAGGTQAQAPIPVVVSQPQQAIPTLQLNLTGDLVAAQRASLSPRIEGLVTRVNVDVGDQVRAGDLLLTLDPLLAEQLLQQSRAATAAAQATYDENLRLVNEAERLTKQNHLPLNELALRKSALAIAKAELDAARAEQQAQATRVAWHQLKAPFDGVISRKLSEAGEWITPGTAVLELVATDKVYLDVQVPQERFYQLKTDTPVRVRPDSRTAEQLQTPLTARIAAIVPVSTSGARTIQVRLVMDNADQTLLPGTSASAQFEFLSGEQNALLIPRDALLRSPDGSFSAFVVVDEGDKLLAQSRRLKLGVQTSDSVEVLDGLQPDDRVVIRGNEILRHNQPVTVVSTVEQVELGTTP